MLCSLNDVLPHARKNHYAVTAFDYIPDLFVRAILDACQEERAPVILSALEYDLQGKGLGYMAGIAKIAAPMYDIPVVLHLDHGSGMSEIVRCIEAGFTSVMFDGSKYPLKENIAKTAEIVKYAHARGVSVEAELGFVAGNDLGGVDVGEGKLTEPKEVEEFVEKTGVDALAVSIGTAHGVYKSTPKLDIKRLGEIMAVTDVPLVLHGGSGTPEDQLTTAIKGGIAKLNIYADMRIAMNSAASKVLEATDKRGDELPDRVLEPLTLALKKETVKKLHLTMSNGRY